MRINTTNGNGPIDAKGLDRVRGACLCLNDGETVRLDVTSKKTGRTVSLRLRRCIDLRVGRSFGATGFYVDVLAGRDWTYRSRVLNGSPAWNWRVERASHKCRCAPAMNEAAGWILDNLFGVCAGSTDKLCRQASVAVRVTTRDGRKVQAGGLEDVSTVKGPVAFVSY